jgi:transposase
MAVGVGLAKGANAMRQLRSSSLVPPGFTVEHAERDSAEMRLTLRHRAGSSRCPECGSAARRVHSHYQRLLGDLPMAGWTVRLRLQARRFRCDAAGCRRRVFTERFDPEVLAPWARRTNRLDELVHHLAIALGGRPASRLARRLMLPVSKDALLRVVRRRGSPRLAPPAVIGIDDWAWRRNQRYGTIICDLEGIALVVRQPTLRRTGAPTKIENPCIKRLVRRAHGASTSGSKRSAKTRRRQPAASQPKHLASSLSRTVQPAIGRSARVRW